MPSPLIITELYEMEISISSGLSPMGKQTKQTPTSYTAPQVIDARLRTLSANEGSFNKQMKFDKA